MDQETKHKLERARFDAQRAEAIKHEQIEKCYRQYAPPQIKYRVKERAA